MSKSKVYNRVGGLIPGKSAFDLSYEKKLTCDMGQLIPIMCDECIPGDVWTIGNQALIRFQPLVAPIMHEINMYVHYFFVPYRLLWEDWEDFITGGEDGKNASVMPTWIPSSAPVTDINTLWDYLGFPINTDPDGAYPIDMPRRAYNFVYNDYYRPEEIVPEVSLTSEDVLIRSWEKDYFSSSQLEQQKGTAPAIPIVGTTNAVWDNTTILAATPVTPIGLSAEGNDATSPYIHLGAGQNNAQTNTIAAYNDNVVNLGAATPFDISDFRLAFQIQKWMERNQRAGARYTEFLGAHFGVSPRDDRLQRPEYIGGTKAPIIVSEVLQTSETLVGTPQGNMSGHGIGASIGFAGKYRCNEFGLIIGIMSVMPRSQYSQGINKQWLRYSKYDFFFPEFANLSEQAVTMAEIYTTDIANDNNTLFGYIGQYDEMRIKPNMTCGEFRTTFNYWHLGREFGSAPSLNQSFLECVPRKDIFADQADPGLMVQFGNLLKAVRPIPFMSNPGLTDHN